MNKRQRFLSLDGIKKKFGIPNPLDLMNPVDQQILRDRAAQKGMSIELFRENGIFVVQI